MISSFTKFNESLTSDIDKLKSDIDDAFAYISDDNKVSTYIRESEVYVDILSTLPNNIVYDNIEEYINKHEIWHETLLDINVAIEQLTSKENVGVVLNINTVGNVKIKFHLIHNKIMKTDKTKIEISVINLTKVLIEEGLEAPDAPASTNFSMREENLYCIKFYSKPNMEAKLKQEQLRKHQQMMGPKPVTFNGKNGYESEIRYGSDSDSGFGFKIEITTDMNLPKY
jgi:hypothetical protein